MDPPFIHNSSQDDLLLEKRNRRQRRASSDLLQSPVETKHKSPSKTSLLSKLSFSTELLANSKGQFSSRAIYLIVYVNRYILLEYF